MKDRYMESVLNRANEMRLLNTAAEQFPSHHVVARAIGAIAAALATLLIPVNGTAQMLFL